MKSWKINPESKDVAKYVECYWFLEKEPGDVGSNYPQLNPDPHAHLILSNKGYKFHYEHNHVFQQGHGSHWIFPHINTYTMDHSEPFRIMGIKFKVGALYPFKTDLPDFKLDAVVPVGINELESLASNSESLLSHSLKGRHEICNKLDAILKPWLHQGIEDKHSELVRNILPLFYHNTPIAQIGTSLQCSQRTIERSFLKVTNLTLKQYQSVFRLENILNYLYKRNDQIDWADIAAKFEFSDQPHLIRYLKSAIGKTPGEYVKQRDLTIDIYGDFEIE